MRRTSVGLLSLALATGVGVTVAAPSVGAAPTAAPAVTSAGDPQPQSSDELSSPPETKRRALKEEALKEVIDGKVKPQKQGNSTVAKLARSKGGGGTDEYVELSREGTDKIFVILTDFGTQRHPSYPDQDTDPNTPGPAVFDGPLNNQIPEPDRSVDNSTNWNADYSRDYDLFGAIVHGTPPVCHARHGALVVLFPLFDTRTRWPFAGGGLKGVPRSWLHRRLWRELRQQEDARTEQADRQRAEQEHARLGCNALASGEVTILQGWRALRTGALPECHYFLICCDR